MIIIKYQKRNHKSIIHAISLALKQGKVVAYPTDTSYGLAIDVTNEQALKKFYKIKERTSKKPVHIVVGTVLQAKKYSHWNRAATILAKKFWPGQLSLVLPIASKGTNKPGSKVKFLKLFSAGTGSIGLRMPNNQIALDIVKQLKSPITATSANPSAHLSGGVDSYSATEVYKQFSKQKYKPDIIIDAGRLPKRKPSTLLKLTQSGSTPRSREVSYEILRQGPITKQKIDHALKKSI